VSSAARHFYNPRARASVWWSGFCSAVETRAYPTSIRRQ